MSCALGAHLGCQGQAGHSRCVSESRESSSQAAQGHLGPAAALLTMPAAPPQTLMAAERSWPLPPPKGSQPCDLWITLWEVCGCFGPGGHVGPEWDQPTTWVHVQSSESLLDMWQEVFPLKQTQSWLAVSLPDWSCQWARGKRTTS